MSLVRGCVDLRLAEIFYEQVFFEALLSAPPRLRHVQYTVGLT